MLLYLVSYYYFLSTILDDSKPTIQIAIAIYSNGETVSILLPLNIPDYPS